jgi:hypothetical protein
LGDTGAQARLADAASHLADAQYGQTRRPGTSGGSRRRPLLIPLLVVFVLSVVGVVWAGFASGRVSLGCTFAPADRCLRILFVGNSYTSTNDLPLTFSRLASSGGWTAETTMVAPGGASLADHAANDTLAAGIADGSGRGPWTAVILQEQSDIPALAANRDALMAPAASMLARRIVISGARPYLLETWAHRDGLPSAGLDYAAMQAAIDEAYRSVARQTGSGLVPAGEAWERAQAAALPIELWVDDGSHPAPAGTYLVACVLYQALTRSSPVGLSETAGLDAATAAALQRIAAGE